MSSRPMRTQTRAGRYGRGRTTGRSEPPARTAPDGIPAVDAIETSASCCPLPNIRCRMPGRRMLCYNMTALGGEYQARGRARVMSATMRGVSLDPYVKCYNVRAGTLMQSKKDEWVSGSRSDQAVAPAGAGGGLCARVPGGGLVGASASRPDHDRRGGKC